MFSPTDTRPSGLRRRLLALIPVAALALIVMSVFVSLRTAVPDPSRPSVPAASVADTAAMPPDRSSHLAQLDAALFPPGGPTTTSSSMTRLAQLDAQLYPPASAAATSPDMTRLAQLDAELYPPAPVAGERSRDR